MTLDEIAFKITDLERLQTKYENKLNDAYHKGCGYFNLIYARLNPKLLKTIKKIELYKKILHSLQSAQTRIPPANPVNRPAPDALRDYRERLKYLYAMLIFANRKAQKKRTLHDSDKILISSSTIIQHTFAKKVQNETCVKRFGRIETPFNRGAQSLSLIKPTLSQKSTTDIRNGSPVTIQARDTKHGVQIVSAGTRTNTRCIKTLKNQEFGVLSRAA